MEGRRSFLTLIGPAAAAALIPGTAKSEATQDLCDYHALCLAQAMKDRHGGNWSVQISHSAAFVAISRDFS